ncbi:hypothetical protein GCM10009730_57100 [Streptomyces albidochromogenes]|uniref:hypothetical protein n=1 Tax=Streptomyces albidochromogenes TaxID=329524 RepID=UPI00110FA4B3|nr:hypothetical protein [Streptomyces albidochromogenes]
MRRTVAAIITVLLIGGATAGCSSSEPDQPAKKAATATATVTATPSLSQAETKRLCSVAVSEAAPGWEDWNFDFGTWEDDPRTPDVCQGLADERFPHRGNREFMDALLEGLGMADDPRAAS